MHTLIGNCRTCGYSLLRLQEPRCPECGTPFDPADPRTMTLHPSRLRDFMARPMTFWTFFPALLCVGTVIGLRIRWPETPWLGLAEIIAFPVVLATLYIWRIRVTFRRYLRKRDKAGKAGPLDLIR